MSVAALPHLEHHAPQSLDDGAATHLHGPSLVRAARAFGRLRLVEPHQATLVRAAAELDKSVLPKWQRGGTGHHEWVEPTAYSRGHMWVRTPTPTRDAQGRQQYRTKIETGRTHLPWRTRDHWLDVVVPAAIKARPEALQTKRGGVAPETLMHYCRTVSLHANRRTGRRCIVRVDRLAELMEISKATVQRCQLAAENLGLYVVVLPGRMLTEAETYRVRQQGSRQRGLANDAALVVPDWLPRTVVAAPLPAPRRPHLRLVPNPATSVDHDTPTSGRYRWALQLQVERSFGSAKRFAGRNEPAPPAQHRRRSGARSPGQDRPQEPQNRLQTRRGRVYDLQALDLARELATRLTWLRGVSPGRLEPGLRRFAAAITPWRGSDIEAAIDHINQRLGRASMTRTLVKAPAALLAHYLRQLDEVADHPGFDPIQGFASSAPPVEVERPRQLANRLLLEAHRGAGAGQTPELRAASLAHMRDEVAQQRAKRDQGKNRE